MAKARRSSGLLTVRQVADRLGVSVRLVYQLIEEGELAGLRVGTKTLRVEQEEVERYLGSLRRNAKAR